MRSRFWIRVASLTWGLLLFGFTVFSALDTFIIEHAYETVEVQPMTIVQPEEETEETKETEMDIIVAAQEAEKTEAVEVVTTETMEVVTTEPMEVVTTENSYSDGNITVTIEEIRAYDSTIYVADVVLSSPEYLKTAFANSVYGRNITEKTSTMANETSAILAVNGDYYGARESGYVIRNGVLYRDKASKNAEDLVIYADGSFGIIEESQVSAQELLEAGAWNVLSFGPALIEDGQIAVTADQEVGKAMASNPRTAIGIIDDLHYVFVVSDGRTNSSAGLSLRELAQVLQNLGVKTAYNLDGGGSSTMVFMGQVVNNPTTNGKRISERSVSDIVYVA